MAGELIHYTVRVSWRFMMEENVRKAKRRLVVFLVVCLSIAFSSFGFVFFMWFSHDLNKGEDVGNVSKEV